MAVLDFYGMFDYQNGDNDTYRYSSEEFSELIAGITGTGVSQNVLSSFQTTASGVSLTVNPGVCFILGRYGANHSTKAISLDATTSSTSRIDRLVIELSVASRTMELKVVKGTAAASSPAIPALTQNALVYQLPLYRILISNGSTTTLTDERPMTYSVTEIQTQLQNRALLSHTHTLAQISGISLSSTAPKVNGTAAAGSSTAVSRYDHVHPTDTTRAAASHTHSLAQISGISLSSAAPKVNGTAAVGSSSAVAREDHVHPTDTTRAAASHAHTLSQVSGISLSTTVPMANGTAAAGSSTAVSRYDHVHPTDTTRASASHTHDDRYFTETEVTNKLSALFNTTELNNTTVNFNNYKTGGLYCISNSCTQINGPGNPGMAQMLLVLANSAHSNGIQLLMICESQYGTPFLKIRSFSGTTFTEWMKATLN